MSEAREPSDEELVRRVRAGDEAAARLLFDRHLPALRAKARARMPAALRGKVGASDVVQEAWLAAFLELLPSDVQAAFEFRHVTWFADDVYEALRSKNVALVGGDADDSDKSPPFVATANFGYLRLRAPEYSDEGLSRWADSAVGSPASTRTDGPKAVPPPVPRAA